jgi:hypothetical protein
MNLLDLLNSWNGFPPNQEEAFCIRMNFLKTLRFEMSWKSECVTKSTYATNGELQRAVRSADEYAQISRYAYVMSYLLSNECTAMTKGDVGGGKLLAAEVCKYI